MHSAGTRSPGVPGQRVPWMAAVDIGRNRRRLRVAAAHELEEGRERVHFRRTCLATDFPMCMG